VPFPFDSVAPDSAAFNRGALDCAAPAPVTVVADCGAVAGVWQLEPGVAVGDAEGPSTAVTAGDAPGLPGSAVGEAPPAGAPAPFPRAPRTVEDWPPVSTLELTWTTACRSGATAIVAETMKATPARTAAGRNQFALAVRAAARDSDTESRGPNRRLLVASAHHPRRARPLGGCDIRDASCGRETRGKDNLGRGQAQ
jgi:hypothetical protein